MTDIPRISGVVVCLLLALGLVGFGLDQWLSAASSDRFADVPVDHWANCSVGWAVNQRITSGVSATEFGGSRTLTREQMITFLYRAKDH